MQSCTPVACRQTVLVIALATMIVPNRFDPAVAQSPAPLNPAARAAVASRTNPSSPEFPASFDDLLAALRSEKDENLKRILLQLENYARKLSLSNAQADLVIRELERIKTTDPYQERWWGKVRRRTPENGRLIYINRLQAGGAIEGLVCLKIANDLAALPLRQRVRQVLAYVENRSTAEEVPKRASDWFRGELWRLGNDAIPYVVERAAEVPELRRMYTEILSARGDPRAVDFILQTLATVHEKETGDACEIIRRLWAFRDPRISKALVEIIQKEVRVTADARYHPQQQAQVATRHRIPFPVKVYPLRACAASMLGNMSKVRWKMLFYQDPRSWQVWWNTADRDSFDPASTDRTREELETLLENFTYRAMREYMGYANWHEKQTPSYMLSEMRPDLLKLGPEVVPILLDTYRAIVAEYPVWEDDLRRWTELVLTTLDTAESRAATKKLVD